MRLPDRGQVRRVTVVAVFTAVKLLVGGMALAALTSTTTVSHSVTTGKLAAPTGLTASNGTCNALSSTRVNLSWTATTSTFADGYEIFRSTTNGGPYTSIATVTGAGTTSYTDATVAFSTTYYYVVQAKRNAWRSPNSNQASVRTPSSLCVL